MDTNMHPLHTWIPSTSLKSDVFYSLIKYRSSTIDSIMDCEPKCYRLTRFVYIEVYQKVDFTFDRLRLELEWPLIEEIRQHG